jgi:gliding motility-associated-like protein
MGINDFSVSDWKSPTIATPDYFHPCNTTNTSVPKNAWGYQYSRTGLSHVGVLASSFDTENEYREYIQCQLKSPLIVGKKYRVSFNVSRADSSTKACDNIGAYFSTTVISSTDNIYLPYTPQVISPLNNPIVDPTGWEEISGTYIAIGGEQYLTIGIFTNNTNTNWTLVSGGIIQEAYYYIDDVCVSEDSFCEFERHCDFALPKAFSPNGDYVNDTYKFIHNCSSIESFIMRIYNRWGKMVFITNDYSIGWDGRYQNESQPFDVYFVYVSVVAQGKQMTKSTSVTLLR